MLEVSTQAPPPFAACSSGVRGGRRPRRQVRGGGSGGKCGAAAAAWRWRQRQRRGNFHTLSHLPLPALHLLVDERLNRPEEGGEGLTVAAVRHQLARHDDRGRGLRAGGAAAGVGAGRATQRGWPGAWEPVRSIRGARLAGSALRSARSPKNCPGPSSASSRGVPFSCLTFAAPDLMM